MTSDKTSASFPELVSGLKMAVFIKMIAILLIATIVLYVWLECEQNAT